MKNWAEIFSTGIEELDQDHNRLLRVAEKIAERADHPDSDKKHWTFLIREGLKYMEGYYQTHIAREEAYMRKINFPHLEAHMQIHREMESTVTEFLNSKLTEEHFDIDDVLTLLGSVYGWQLIHIATEDLAIADKGPLARPAVDVLDESAVVKELDVMLEEFLNIDPKTQVLDRNYNGESINSGTVQKITYCIDGKDVMIILGSESAFMRNITDLFWLDKQNYQELDRAHAELLQWAITAFCVGFWRNMIGRLSHCKTCTLKKVDPMSVQDTRQYFRNVKHEQSILYGTSIGRFFLACDHQ
jgi:hemerythrin-like metal-binding protein